MFSIIFRDSIVLMTENAVKGMHHGKQWETELTMRTYGLDFTNMHYCKIIHPWRKNLAAKLERTPISYSCLFYTYSPADRASHSWAGAVYNRVVRWRRIGTDTIGTTIQQGYTMLRHFSRSHASELQARSLGPLLENSTSVQAKSTRCNCNRYRC